MCSVMNTSCMKIMKIASGIVTYNPNPKRFYKCLASIAGQCNLVVVYDNGSTNIDIVKRIINNTKGNIYLIKGEKNNGIAFALNRIVEKACEMGYEWLITLDHDSICPDNLVSEYEKYLDIPHTAALCPQILDKETVNSKYSSSINNGITEVKICIQSGTAFNIPICLKLGMFYEWYFIDYVDFDYCTCCRLNGYKIFRVNSITLDHKMGEKVKTKYAKIGEFLYDVTSFRPFLYLTYKTSFNEFRMFYQFRNNIVYIKRFSSYYGTFLPCLKLFIKVFRRIIRSNCRISTIKGIFRGVIAGIKYKPKKFKVINNG